MSVDEPLPIEALLTSLSLCFWDCNNESVAYEFGKMVHAQVMTPSADQDQLVAVITSSFQVIREESRTSAFTTDEQ